jgi:hypothetical protein
VRARVDHIGQAEGISGDLVRHLANIHKEDTRASCDQREPSNGVGQLARGVELLVACSEKADDEETPRVNRARSSEANRHTFLEPQIPY